MRKAIFGIWSGLVLMVLGVSTISAGAQEKKQEKVEIDWDTVVIVS